ncbi:phenylacetyl-CoA ligase [Penicillium chermesinum]|uniref:Phenylacetyl-CoA ligase n=1 Tax=Penicillium chermesinum TaxID=63820 RepID=A0A9W9P0M5_9EURO|nr:phenylacetyl-CoA ligase [Penicillium chermesinum]KAJ5232905.1 phenylacetyl-CoA ligase [Penicillium chermesinum]
MKGPMIPSAEIWPVLFDRPSLPSLLIKVRNVVLHSSALIDNTVIFRSATTNAVRTYHDILRQATSFGSALQSEWNWKKGDVLLVMAPNHVDVPATIWGCHYAGGVVSPANPGLSVRDLRQQLEGSRACGLVVPSQCLPVALEAARSANFPTDRILVLESDSSVDTLGVSSVLQLVVSAQEKQAPLRPRVPLSPSEDTAYLVYSSGTTGRPKAVMVSHRNVVAAIVMQTAVEGPHLDWRVSRTLAILPIYHIYGLVCLVHLPMYLGTTTFFMDKFDVQLFCQHIQSHKISHAYVAPPVVLHLAKSPLVQNYNLSSLKMLTSGGAPLGCEPHKGVVQETRDSSASGIWIVGDDCRLPYPGRFSPIEQIQSIADSLKRWDDWRSGIGSNGPPIPGLESKFVRSDGSTAAKGEEGELWIRSPTVFNGYRDEPEMTAGWDIGYEDEHRNMFITDRSKDLIKFKGYQVAPAELEDLILESDAVRDAAVIGIMNDDLASEVPLAYIVLKEGRSENAAKAQEVIDHVKKRAIHYKHLRGGIIFTNEIPKGPSGKILKRVLRERAVGVDKARRIGAVEYGKYQEGRTAKL